MEINRKVFTKIAKADIRLHNGSIALAGKACNVFLNEEDEIIGLEPINPPPLGCPRKVIISDIFEEV